MYIDSPLKLMSNLRKYATCHVDWKLILCFYEIQYANVKENAEEMFIIVLNDILFSLFLLFYDIIEISIYLSY